MKPLEAALGRLAGALPAPERRDLQCAMLAAVLAACASSKSVSEVLVVTGDVAAIGMARAIGAHVVPDYIPPRGMNPAVSLGCAAADARGADAALVLTADLPLARALDIDVVVACASSNGAVVLVPSRDGTGTNAMLLHGPDALDPELGPGSLVLHEAQATRRGVGVTRCERPTLALDIDTPDDLAALWEVAPQWDTRQRRPDSERVAAGSMR